MNQLILGDCLTVLKTLESESVDLIYLDPPFFSNRNYEVIWGDAGEIRSFQDRWSGGIDHYIAWLKERVQELHRVLKPTGSIFLHCDWHSDAYIRVYILDKIFGENSFRNEIIWAYKRPSAPKQKQLSRLHDNIFWYSKSVKAWQFNGDKIRIPYADSSLARAGYVANASKMTDGGVVELKEGGKLPEDWWDISMLKGNSKEWIGYPTQKPEALLERIINMASNEGDIILDPFLGGGTTIAVADRLKRHWIGIDQSVAAIKVSELRLNKQRDMFSTPFSIQLHKYDYDTLRYSNALEFETWIIQQYGGVPNTKQRSDLGIDGRNKDGIPIQVKRSDNIGRNVIDNFLSACKRYDSNRFETNKQANQSIGIIIAFSFGKGAIQEVARLKNEENISIQLITVDNIVVMAKKPTISVSFTELNVNEKQLHEIEFTATATSDSGIEFFSWDWNYNANEGFKPEILRDKDGKQIQKFKSGAHCVAVKVIDNDGLENMAVVELKINTSEN
jgi:DNA modification methylase